MPTAALSALNALLHAPRWRPWWRVVFAALLVIVATLAFMPGDDAPDLTGFDKANHLLAFGALAFVGTLAALTSTAALVPVLIGYGGFIELVQAFLPTRSAEWQDIVADAAGIVLGLAAITLLRRCFRWLTP